MGVIDTTFQLAGPNVETRFGGQSKFAFVQPAPAQLIDMIKSGSWNGYEDCADRYREIVEHAENVLCKAIFLS